MQRSGMDKILNRSYSIETRDSDTDQIVAILNLEDTPNNCHTDK